MWYLIFLISVALVAFFVGLPLDNYVSYRHLPTLSYKDLLEYSEIPTVECTLYEGYIRIKIDKTYFNFRPKASEYFKFMLFRIKQEKIDDSKQRDKNLSRFKKAIEKEKERMGK